ncbi:MAG: prepilin-type N-terminal cleavage/methylation domain-containing protein [Desulfobia sp.]
MEITKGFSLFEMLIVLIVLSIIAGVSAPAIGKFLDNLVFSREVGSITAHLRKYRLEAVTKGEKVAVWQEGRQFFTSPLKKEGKMLWYEGSEERNLTMEPARVVFTPCSTVTPARLSLRYNSRKGIIRLDPLSGLPVVQ